MTSLQIHYFLTAAEYMSFSRAAQELYVSQPSVSRQIKLLEDELGYPLFDRSRKNAISLTAAGIVFREAFLTSRRQYEAAKTMAKAVTGQPTLRLNVGVGTYWDLSHELRLFRENVRLLYPQAVLCFESNDFKQLRSQLRAGTLDAIVCTKTSLTVFEELEIMQIAAPKCLAYVRRGLLRPADEPLQVEDFQGQRLMMLSEDESPMAMELAQMQFFAHQVTVEPVFMPNRETILQALLLGDGVAVFDEYMRFNGDPRLASLQLDERIPISVVWDRRNHNPLVRLFADSMKNYMSR